MSESIITNIAKNKIIRVRAGLLPALPKIVGMAFGDGAASGSSVRTPLATDTALQNELLRQDIDGVALQEDQISALYTSTLSKSALAGKNINELALYDEEGDLVAIKSFSSKGKDGDMEMGFDVLDRILDITDFVIS